MIFEVIDWLEMFFVVVVVGWTDGINSISVNMRMYMCLWFLFCDMVCSLQIVKYVLIYVCNNMVVM